MMLEILFANIEDAALILRVISRVSGAGGEERFLADSELADFGERLFERVEEAGEALNEFHPGRDDSEEARQVASRLERAAGMMAQMELSLAFTPEGAWGARFQELKLRMGRALDGLLGLCPRMVDKALPMERVRIHGSMSRMAPVMDARGRGAGLCGPEGAAVRNLGETPDPVWRRADRGAERGRRLGRGPHGPSGRALRRLPGAGGRRGSGPNPAAAAGGGPGCDSGALATDGLIA